MRILVHARMLDCMLVPLSVTWVLTVSRSWKFWVLPNGRHFSRIRIKILWRYMIVHTARSAQETCSSNMMCSWVWAYAQPASCHRYVETFFKYIHMRQTKYCLPFLQAHRCILFPCSTVCNEIQLGCTGDEQHCMNNSKCCNFSK